MITIPSLLQSWEERATVTKLRKTYSAFQQAFKLAEIENGPVQNAYASRTEYAKAIIKYLPVIKDCGSNLKGCAADYKNLNGFDYSSTEEYYAVESSSAAYKVLLNDGVGFYISFTAGCNNAYSGPYYSGKFCNLSVVDVNGPKPPNIIGKDMFCFSTTIDGIIPSGGSSTSYCHAPHSTCKTSGNGVGCARWVIERGNMDYLHKTTTW